MNLECLISKFCELKGIANNCNDEINDNHLNEFKEFINNEFLDKSIGNIILKNRHFVKKDSLAKVMNSLKRELLKTIRDDLLYKIRLTSGLRTESTNANVTWLGHQSFIAFRESMTLKLKEMLPSLLPKGSVQLIPNKVEQASTLQDIYKQIGKVFFQEIDNLIKGFCSNRRRFVTEAKLMTLMLVFVAFFAHSKPIDCPIKSGKVDTFDLKNIYQCLHKEISESNNKSYDKEMLEKTIEKNLAKYTECIDGDCNNLSLKELNILKSKLKELDSEGLLDTDDYRVDLYDEVKECEKTNCFSNDKNLKTLIDNECDVSITSSYSLLKELKFFEFPSRNVFYGAILGDSSSNCIVEQISKTKNDLEKDIFSSAVELIVPKINIYDNNDDPTIIKKGSLKRKIYENFEPKKKKSGYFLAEKKDSEDKKVWDLKLFIGDSIDSSLSKKFTNPAKLTFDKSAGEETEEALNAALRLDFNNVDANAWDYALGYDIEKSTKSADFTDIRGYYYQQSKFTKQNYGIELGLNKIDNFKTGYEAAVGSITFSPAPKMSDRYSFGRWSHFKKNKRDINKWKWFITPLFGVEVNYLLENPTNPELFFISDENFIFSKIEMGLKRYNFEITYLINRRYSIKGDRHLSYQTIDFDLYLDKNERFSIGLEGKIGQRPFDEKHFEKYQLSFGFKL